MIGFDGSPQGEDALVLGRILGEALDATPTVAIVAHYPPRHTPEGDELDASLAEFCEPLFATARDRLDGLQLREQPILNGSVGRGLTELVDELSPVLMVIGSARHGQLGEVVLGGVGGSLLSGCRCAIAVAPLGFANGKRQLGRIGAGVHGTPQSLRALGAAAVLAESAKTPVRVMTVDEPHHYALGGALSPLNPEEYDHYKEEQAQGVLDEAVENVPEGISAEPRLLRGPAAERTGRGEPGSRPAGRRFPRVRSGEGHAPRQRLLEADQVPPMPGAGGASGLGPTAPGGVVRELLPLRSAFRLPIARVTAAQAAS